MSENTSYMTKAQRCRAEELAALSLIFEGEHKKYFLEDRRTQFDFRPVSVNGRVLPVFVHLNVLGLISTKGADLLFIDPPAIRAEDVEVQTAINDIIDRTALPQVLHEAAVEASWAKETFLEISRQDNKAYIGHVPAAELYPVGALRPDKQYGSYVRFVTEDVVEEGKAETLLLETWYEPGKIRRVCKVLTGGKWEASTIARWAAATGQAVKDEEPTGLSRCSIVWVPNQLHGGKARGDYSKDLIALQDELNAKQTQVARVLAKHADPKMYFATPQAGEDGNVRATDDAYFGDSPDAKPGYITWDAQLQHAIEDRKFTLNALCFLAEMSPSLLGLKEGAAPEAAKKLRLEATNSLAKASRKASYWQPAIRLAMELALEADGVSTDDVYVSVEMRDGLPVDPNDVADEIATLRGAKVISVERSLDKQGLDTGAKEKELARLATEAKAATPTVFLEDEPANDTTAEVPAA